MTHFRDQGTSESNNNVELHQNASFMKSLWKVLRLRRQLSWLRGGARKRDNMHSGKQCISNLATALHAISFVAFDQVDKPWGIFSWSRIPSVPLSTETRNGFTLQGIWFRPLVEMTSVATEQVESRDHKKLRLRIDRKPKDATRLHALLSPIAFPGYH